MAKTIILELHREHNACTLYCQDIYKYISEETDREIELALYIEKWCEFLNYHIINNKEMLFGDSTLAKLEGWITGYNFAKKIKVEYFKDRVEIKMRGYFIILNKPFEF